MQSRSYLFLLIVLALGVLSGLGYHYTNYDLGLDVKGGVRLTYKMDTSELTADQKNNLEQVKGKLLDVLQNRVAKNLGVVEGNVFLKGVDEFIVELPGYTDIENAKGVIGSSAAIKFYHAKNVVTPKSEYRTYRYFDESDDPDNPTIVFQRTSGAGDVIEPGTDEYKEVIEGWDEILRGDDLKKASMEPYGGGYVPKMEFSAEGARKMTEWSGKFYNRREMIAAVMDDRVISIASVQDNTRLTDHAIITGTFSPEYVRNLVSLFNAGSLPIGLEQTSAVSVDPTIGKHALDKIISAGVIAFGLMGLFLIVYYAFPGFVALIALILYCLFTLTVLKLINATFSLAAIAGFVLSVGMAVDANILVFERFKEELKGGKSLQTALELGFKRALPAIVDSNACTILTSLVLYNLGTGPVKGFATTLIIGVAISLFTAITVTRSLLMFLVNSGIGTNIKWYAVNRSWFGEKFEASAHDKPLTIVNKWRKWFAISALLIVLGVPFMFMGGFKLNVEFTGGYEASYAMDGKDISTAQIIENLEAAGFEGANAQFGGADNARLAIIKVPPTEQLAMGTPEVRSQLATAAGFAPGDERGFSEIGPSVSTETRNNAILGVIFSSILIVLYLTIRFGVALGGLAGGFRFGFSAILALIHDVLFVVGMTAVAGYLLNWELSALFITSMLTVIGFSVHDSIVVFDRIRENLRRAGRADHIDVLINRSVTQSIARSINTSFTVVLTLAILLFLGSTTPDLKLFCLTMLLGIAIGTYSSLYTASPILYIWDRMIARSQGKDKTLIDMALRESERTRIVSTRVDDVVPDVVGHSGRSYGQIKRKSRDPKKRARINIDDE